MRKIFLGTLFALSAFCLLGVSGSATYGQERGRDNRYEHHQGLVQDWSGHHVVYSRIGPRDSIIAAQKDVRALDSWANSIRKDGHRWHFGQLRQAKTTTNRDWSISLGGGGMAQNMYPAKYTFDPNATPDCTTDFIVYPVNVAGSGTQPNIVGLNNLYSGTAGGTGICNRTPSVSDTGVAATVLWSYNVNAIAGAVATSPVLSLDGTKVAFVETAAGVPAHFHVLAWKSGDGQNAANLQSVASPVAISAFTANAPSAGSGTASDLTLGATAADTNTNSSPFIDYATDEAYVGNDNGTIFRIKNVFCPNCTGTPPAPSLDTTWGSAGALAVCAGSKMSSVTRDGGTANIFVGCANGDLYGYTPAGVALAGSPLAVGNGSATGGIVDPPMIDAISHFVYAVSGASTGGRAVLVQAKSTDMSGLVTATLGAGGVFNVHDPAFNDAYFTSGTSTNWLLYVFSVDTGNTTDELFGVGFNGSRVMNAGTPTNFLVSQGGTPELEFSPLTEFLNGGTDQIFFSVLTGLANNFIALPITTFPASYAAAAPATEGALGTSGIVVDNASASAQASSIYFGTLGGTNTAVKLTQAGLL